MNDQKKLPEKLLTLIFMVALVTMASWYLLIDRNKPLAEMIIIIGVDGMSIPGFQRAHTPNMDVLVRNGALSFRTRSVMPTVSGPNWSSHLLGAGPEQHGVTFNGWAPDNISIMPTVTDEQGYFPSVFSVVRQQMPEAVTGFFYDWDVLIDVFNQQHISRVEYSDFYTETFAKAIPWIVENKPLLTFLYIGNPDSVGHEFMWESPQYVKSLEDVDVVIGNLMDAMKEAGLYDDTHFIIASDHGGIEYGHGGVSMDEIKVPWLISGPGIIENRMISQPNDVFNTAPTIIHLLGLEQPWEWIGRPMKGAFAGTEMASQNSNVYVPQPFSSIKGGIYDTPVEIDFTVVPAGPQVRYELNGDIPGSGSPLWEDPVELTESTVIRAASFDGRFKSRITDIEIWMVQPVSNISLKNPPAEKYSSSGVLALIDRQMASTDFLDGKWLGFETKDLVATLTLPELRMVSAITMGYLYNPGSWIFEPQWAKVEVSVDGRSWKEAATVPHGQIMENNINGKNTLRIAVEKQDVRYIRLSVANIGVCPAGHPGEGQPAWLFVDEILVE